MSVVITSKVFCLCCCLCACLCVLPVPCCLLPSALCCCWLRLPAPCLLCTPPCEYNSIPFTLQSNVGYREQHFWHQCKR